MGTNRSHATMDQTDFVSERPTAADRPATTTLLKELAYVFHLTRSVKRAILEQKDCPAVLSA